MHSPANRDTEETAKNSGLIMHGCSLLLPGLLCVALFMSSDTDESDVEFEGFSETEMQLAEDALENQRSFVLTDSDDGTDGSLETSYDNYDSPGRSTLADCPLGAVMYPRHSRCYWLTSTVATASSAHAQCQAEGGELGEVWQMDAMFFVASKLQLPTYEGCSPPPCGQYWLGHRDSGTGSLVTWQGEKPCWGGAPSPGMPCTTLLYNQSKVVSYSSDCSLLRLAICSKLEGNPTVLQDRWRALRGARMPKHLPHLSKIAASASHCARACEIRSCCSTFSFRKSDGVCEMSVSHKASIMEDLVSDPEFAYYQRVY